MAASPDRLPGRYAGYSRGETYGQFAARPFQLRSGTFLDQLDSREKKALPTKAIPTHLDLSVLTPVIHAIFEVAERPELRQSPYSDTTVGNESGEHEFPVIGVDVAQFEQDGEDEQSEGNTLLIEVEAGTNIYDDPVDDAIYAAPIGWGTEKTLPYLNNDTTRIVREGKWTKVQLHNHPWPHLPLHSLDDTLMPLKKRNKRGNPVVVASFVLGREEQIGRIRTVDSHELMTGDELKLYRRKWETRFQETRSQDERDEVTIALYEDINDVMVISLDMANFERTSPREVFQYFRSKQPALLAA